MSVLLAAWSVCRDRLLDAGASPEMVERMTRAMEVESVPNPVVPQSGATMCPECRHPSPSASHECHTVARAAS